LLELQNEFHTLSEETTKLQATLSESDENFLVLFTENETIRTLLGAQLKELHNTTQAISDLSRLNDKLAQKGRHSQPGLMVANLVVHCSPKQQG
jgi:regulator of replication initiation timing